MARIMPSSDLRNRYNEISKFCNTHHEPVFITKNGSGDLVVLSNDEYERLTARLDLHQKLDDAYHSMLEGGGRPAKEVFAELKGKYLANA